MGGLLKKRYKLATAYVSLVNVICPFKNCNGSLRLIKVHKGDILKCPNCHKEYKVKKVV